MAKGYKKSRTPYYFHDDDYMGFMSGIVKFINDSAGEPDLYPHHALIPPLAQTFADILEDYANAPRIEKEQHSRQVDAFEALLDSMQQLKRMLPGLFGNDHMLDDFALAGIIEHDIEKVLLRSRKCKDHWKTVENEPEYAPLTGFFKIFLALQAAYEQAVVDYNVAVDNTEKLQNEKLASREACNDAERQMFTWYRGLHTSPFDEWWTETPWGKSPGKDDKKFPAPKMLMYDQYRNEFSWSAVPETNKYELEITKDGSQPVIAETDKNMKRVELEDGDYSSKVRAIKKENGKSIYSKWSDVFDFVIKPAPEHFKYNPGLKELSWSPVAGATMYEVRQEGSFTPIYFGSDTSFVLDLPAGQYKLRVRAGDEMQNWWTEWSETLLVVV